MTQYGVYHDIFRAIVEETFEGGYVTVVFVDLGDKTTVPYYECYEVPVPISLVSNGRVNCGRLTSLVCK